MIFKQTEMGDRPYLNLHPKKSSLACKGIKLFYS